MKRFLGGLIVGIVLLFGYGAYAELNDDPSFVRTELCDYWRYEFDIRGYICIFRSASTDLVTAREYQSKIAELEQRLSDLEAGLRR